GAARTNRRNRSCVPSLGRIARYRGATRPSRGSRSRLRLFPIRRRVGAARSGGAARVRRATLSRHDRGQCSNDVLLDTDGRRWRLRPLCLLVHYLRERFSLWASISLCLSVDGYRRFCPSTVAVAVLVE